MSDILNADPLLWIGLMVVSFAGSYIRKGEAWVFACGAGFGLASALLIAGAQP